ncbi:MULTISPECIES: hypothetical protein [unclassified Variovorax]|uniref:hypothetical protein n=1 Tax=unclassified Variovorax TaxID=663243 RepID=UPI001317B768|nr:MULTISPECIES: hypothetical protein [unclassified Variovorax]VTU43038.1 hypothetical protein SRS16P1_00421 [Variovorax sp. SRS16]VTU43070.1 hypothetical protein E5P1_00419 [Variovorax sp. PBL-E5]VTU43498.1 hypothetical protein H6P1_00485 [Variovorax sp. PBL-H6]
MNDKELIRSLNAIAQGASALRGPVGREIFRLLARNESTRMMTLGAEAARPGNDGALEELDGMLSSSMFQPLRGGGNNYSSGYALAALATVFARPRGVTLNRLSDPRAVAADLSKASGISPERLDVLPGHLNAAKAFGLSPTLAFQICAQLKDGHVQEAEPNCWREIDETPFYDETMLLVRVKDGTPEDLEKLQASPLSFAAEYSDGVASRPPLSVTHSCLMVGSPWPVLRSVYHIKQAHTLSVAMKRVADATYTDESELSAYVAVLTDRASGKTSTRAAIHHPSRGLVAGISEQDIDEPEQYVLVANKLLGRTAVRLCGDAFAADTIDTDGPYSFLVPGQGWQRAAITNTGRAV